MSKLVCLKCRAQPGAQTADDAKKLAKDCKAKKGKLLYYCRKCGGGETLYYFEGYGRNAIKRELELDGEVEKAKNIYYEYAKSSRPTHNALERFSGGI